MMSSNDLWLNSFREKLQVMDWNIQFAINLDDFKIRFVESEIDILILRGIDDQATFEYLQTICGVSPSFGLIWIYPGGEYLSSPYFGMADHKIPLETSDNELIAMSQSLLKLLKRCGWR